MKILLTGAVNWTKEHLDAIKSLGHDVTFVQDERIPLAEQNVDATKIEGVICNGLFLYNDIKSFNNLQFIQLTSAGFDRVDMDYINQKGIKICNARGVYSVPMAEFCLASVLSLYKNSAFFYDNKNKKLWQKNRQIKELSDSEVLIVGCGSVGSECAKRFLGFNTKVYGVDLFVTKNPNFIEIFPLDLLDERLKSADIVVLTLPLTNETKGLFNLQRLLSMKKGSVLVNIARGPIVDEKALVKALNGHLFGACLDVFEVEPLPQDSQLWELENVILSPHNSFVSDKNINRLFDVVINNLKG